MGVGVGAHANALGPRQGLPRRSGSWVWLSFRCGWPQAVGAELAGVAPNGILEDAYAVQDASGRQYYVVHVQFGGEAPAAASQHRCRPPPFPGCLHCASLDCTVLCWSPSYYAF